MWGSHSTQRVPDSTPDTQNLLKQVDFRPFNVIRALGAPALGARFAYQTVNSFIVAPHNTSENPYIFKLREGVKFHNGADFTAADVEYTFNHNE